MTCRILVAARGGWGGVVEFPDQGLNPGPSALRAWSPSRYTTRKVPGDAFLTTSVVRMHIVHCVCSAECPFCIYSVGARGAHGNCLLSFFSGQGALPGVQDLSSPTRERTQGPCRGMCGVLTARSAGNRLVSFLTHNTWSDQGV